MKPGARSNLIALDSSAARCVGGPVISYVRTEGQLRPETKEVVVDCATSNFGAKRISSVCPRASESLSKLSIVRLGLPFSSFVI